MPEYIYIIQEREFVGTNVYKIGKTKQENTKRINSYSKGSELELQIKCTNCDLKELQLITLFKEKYIHRRDLGNEYFEGNVNNMKRDIFNESLVDINDSDSEDSDSEDS